MALLREVLIRCVARPVRSTWKARVSGIENMPREGGVVIVSNHLSVADPVIIMAAVSRPVAYWAKEALFTGGGFKGLCSRSLMRAVGAIPVQRDDDSATAGAALEAARVHLVNGGLMGVFPEGTRSSDGRLYRGRTGAARLAHAAQVPIVPVGITGTVRVEADGRRQARFERGAATAAFGEPILPPGPGAAVGPKTFRRMTDTVMAAVANLSGQEYVPVYSRPATDIEEQ